MVHYTSYSLRCQQIKKNILHFISPKILGFSGFSGLFKSASLSSALPPPAWPARHWDIVLNNQAKALPGPGKAAKTRPAHSEVTPKS